MNPIAPFGDGGTPFGDGRDAAGRFAPGNPGGPGNPEARRVARFRRAFLKTVTPADVEAVIQVLIDHAKKGEPWAVREVLDRAIGKPAVSVTVEAHAADRPRTYVVPPPRVLIEVAADSVRNV